MNKISFKRLRNLLTIACFVACTGLSADAQDDLPQYKLDVKDFYELKVKDGINVDYFCNSDSAGTVIFNCPEELASVIMFTNDKNRLTIQLSKEAREQRLTNLPTIRLYSSIIEKVENSGDSTVYLAKVNPVAKFKATIVGNGTLIVNDLKAHETNASINTGHGHLVISGETLRANLQNIGTGPLEAGMLKANEVSCKLLGTGPIDCYATETLKILGMGSGKVIYDGNPKKVINRSVGVKITNLNDTKTQE